MLGASHLAGFTRQAPITPRSGSRLGASPQDFQDCFGHAAGLAGRGRVRAERTRPKDLGTPGRVPWMADTYAPGEIRLAGPRYR
jgi:hypothetical protein